MVLKFKGSRVVVVLIILAAETGFLWEATRVWLAQEYALSANPELRRRATELSTDNAATWALLGSMEEADMDPTNLKRAAADYEAAVRVNPHSDRNWLELAGIYERLGNNSQARVAYEEAQSDHPASSAVAWRFGNFLLRVGDSTEACSQIRSALATNPSLTEEAAAAWWESELYRTIPITKILPPQNSYYLKALDYFSRRDEFGAALRVWDGLIGLGQHFELPPALPFLDSLIASGRTEDAQRVWQTALAVSNWPRDDANNDSFIFNGGFENDPVNGGFDWRLHTFPGTAMNLDTGVAHSGRHSLRISFDGSANFDFHDVSQFVAVEPQRRYRLTAFLRSDNLSTDSGIYLSVEDPLHAGVTLSATRNVTGTMPWTQMQTEYVTSAGAYLLKIVIRREPSSRIDNKLRGTVWLDDISLTAIDGDGHSRQR